MENETIDTSGFYKKDNEILLYAPNFVLNKDYELYKEKRNYYNYPINGWVYFDNEIKAKEYFGF